MFQAFGLNGESPKDNVYLKLGTAVWPRWEGSTFCILRLPAVALSPGPSGAGAPGSKGRRRVLRFALPVSPESQEPSGTKQISRLGRLRTRPVKVIDPMHDILP